MTVFVDSKAREINIVGARSTEGLEAITGSDLMVSRLSLPASNRTLILKHVQAGALLVQVKKNEDMASSIGDRLNDSIARMSELVGIRQCQCVLLFIGVMTEDASGYAIINGRRTHMNKTFRDVNRAISKWMYRGGVYHNLSRETQLASWCEDQIKILNDCFDNPVKHVYQLGDYPDDPPVDDPELQLPVRVKGMRKFIFALDDMGYVLTERVYKHCGDGWEMLNFLTDEANAGVVDGIGKGKIRSIRNQLGLHEDDGPIVVLSK